jgi:NAD(P)H-flavin reductase
MLGYEYTSPTADELALRRKQLDQAGFEAWVTPTFILLHIYISRRLAPSFPSSLKNKDLNVPSHLEFLGRRLTWVLQSSPFPEYGPLFLNIFAVVYLSYVFYVATKNTGNDYLHLTKALGHVAISQLPLHYLLAMKSPTSPLTLATAWTHERLNSVHRLLGRIVAILAFSHATLYLKFFLDKGLLRKRLGDWDVRLGLMAFTLVALMSLLALPMVRKRAYYRGFYVGHVLGSALLLVVLWAHMRWTRRYVVQAACFWVANILLRWRDSRPALLEVQAPEGAKRELLRLTVNLSEGHALTNWVPGQHVYLHTHSRGLLSSTWGRKNPFTIATVSANDKDIELVVRRMAGTTVALSNVTGSKPKSIWLEGPYGEASIYLPHVLRSDQHAGDVLLVAGGVGATYTVPIYLVLSKQAAVARSINMVWFVRSLDETTWAMDLLKSASSPLQVQIHVTQANTESSSTGTKIEGLDIIRHGKRPVMGEVLQSALRSEVASGRNVAIVGHSKRDPRKSRKTYPALTVMLCGPPGLARAVRTEVGKQVMAEGREVQLYEEQFGFGGS